MDKFAKQNEVPWLFGTLGVNQAGIRWKECVLNCGVLRARGKAQVVTTNREKSAEVIVVDKVKKTATDKGLNFNETSKLHEYLMKESMQKTTFDVGCVYFFRLVQSVVYSLEKVY